MSDDGPPPLGRLALTWALSLASLGLFFPYGTWYLSRTLGLSGGAVGTAMAGMSLMGMVAQTFWGQLADRTGRRTRTLTAVSLGAAFSYPLCALPESPTTVALALAGLAFFYSAVSPNLWAVTLGLLDHGKLTHVGLSRVAGTLGFLAAVSVFPLLIERLAPALDGLFGVAWNGSAHADGHGVRMIFPLAGLFSLGAALCSLTLPRTGGMNEPAAPGGVRYLLTYPPFLRLLLLAFLCFLFMQGPMVLFPLLVHAQGGGPPAIAHMWQLMVLLEVPLVTFFGATVARLGIERVVLIGVWAGAVRWLVSGFVDDLNVVAAVQLLHGVTVWGMMLGFPNLIHRVVPSRLRSTGQALLSTLGLGLGSMASNAIGGRLVEFGDASTPARVGGIGAALLALVLPFMLRRALQEASDRGAEQTPSPTR